MKLLNISTLAVAALLGAAPAIAEQITSPDGRTVVDVYAKDGVPVYTVAYDGAAFIEESPLGFVLNTGDFTKGMKFDGLSGKTAKTPEHYSIPTIKKTDVTYAANAATATFSKDNEAFQVQFEVSDNNVAFRYIIDHKGDPKCAVVEDEVTGYVLPQGTTTFLCPQMTPMSGFARTGPSYETHYKADAPMGENGWGDGYVFPALFKVGDAGWMLLSETGLDGSYCGSHIKNLGDNKYAIAFPNPKEMNGLGTGVGIAFPLATPWRTITVGNTLAPIMETTITTDLVKPYYEPSQEYKYGKGTWSWITRQRDSGDYDETMEFINLAADLGYTSVLVDACWDTLIGYDKIEELAAIAREKGVDLFLWYNSNGYWNDAPQTPRHVMSRERQRRDEMAWMKRNGIRGIKVDFFGSDKQPMIQLYEDILKDANDYGLEVIFHGCTLPRGWERMYPNFVAAEAVRASENLFFGHAENDMEAFNATFHPVCRNTVASMDFGGSTLNRYWNAKDEPGRGNVRRTSDVFQLATAVMFQSPVQHFALTPENLTHAPEWALNFMKEVPVQWNDVKFIDGYPGRYMIMARRSGDKWYITGINAQPETVKAKIDLAPFTDAKEVTLYSDDKNLTGSLKTAKLNKKKELPVEIPTNGAFLIVAPAL